MIRLRLLGPMSLEWDDGTPVRSVLAQPKRFALLAYLAASHPSGPRRRDTLLGLFWPDSDQEHARNSLRQSLYQIRRSLGGDALTGEGSERVGIDRDRLWCDAAAFDDLLADDRPEEALELYRGAFLEGFHLSGVPEFERWLQSERRRRRRLALEAAWKLAEAVEVDGDRTGARAWAEKALELAPYDEEGLRRYLNLMDRLGQPAAAVQAYEAYARRLAEDLDLRPSPETAAAIGRIREEEHRQSPGSVPAGRLVTDAVRPASEGHLSSTVDTEGDEDLAVEEIVSTSPPENVRRTEAWRRASNLAGRQPLLAIVGILALGALGFAGVTALVVNESSGGEVPRIRSLAVLPLENYSGDPEQEYFTDGMTEALIAELGAIEGLRVISRTSVMGYKDTDKPSPEIARELGADALIEGSVLKAGDEVRITLQLVHGPTDRHLWAKSYERKLRDVLALQGEVARNIAGEMQFTLAPETETRLARADPVDPEAYEAYLKGRYRYASVTQEDFRAALSQLRDAVARDPTFAEAYAALAVVCVHPRVLGTDTELGECRAWANRAVELAPGLAEAHAGLGRVTLAAWEWQASEAAFRRAIELNPNSLMARSGYSELLWITKRPGKALEQIRTAEKLDPLNLFVKTAVSWPLFVQGRIEQAAAQLDEVLELDSEFWVPVWNRGEAFVLMGNAPEALESAQRLADLPILPAKVGAQSLTVGGLAVAGEKQLALEALAEFEDRYGDVTPAQIALAQLQLGREDEALDWFERAFESHDQFLPAAMAIPWSDAVRDRPRFRTLERRLGIDEYGSL